ncbi:MAG: hypothetical protein ACXAEB_06925 [Candidatus Thorarchaeota archaeon]
MSRKSLLLSLFLLFLIPFATVNQGYSTITDQIERNSEFTFSSSDSVIWHDDCSNTSSFPDLAGAWYTGAMGSITSESGYIYATDYGSSTGSHGPVYYHTFTPAITIGQLDWLEAEIELNGSSAMGAAAIMLYDSDYKRIAILDVADSWTAQDDTAAYAGWYDVDFTPAYTPKSWPDDTVAEPYHETLQLEINSTGLYGLIPRVGDFKMLDVGDLELERGITYLCVQFRQKDSYTPCQTMRIYDIKMQYRPEDTEPPSEVIWHDDCSNTSSFPDLADAWYTGAMGSIASENGYIYATDFGSSTGSHGPVYYHTLTSAITIGQLDWLEAEIELDGSSAIGAAAIMLYDSDYNRIAILDVADSWVAQDATAAYAGWYDVDFTPAYTPKDWPDGAVPEPYHETLRLEINSTGLYGLIPRLGDFKMLDVGDLELERDITYLCVQFRQLDTYTPCQTMRIHDIKMQYRPEVDTDPPIITGLSDSSFEYGSVNPSIDWHISEANPDYYWIEVDEIPTYSGPWNGSDISISIEGLDLGVYNFTLIVRDAFDQFSVDSVIVTIEDTTAPTINHPNDIVIHPDDTNSSISWDPDDLKPENYEIYQNGTLIATGIWNNTTIVYNLTNLQPGTYVYLIIVYDSSGNSVSDTVLVVVEEPPSVFIPLDLTLVISIGSIVIVVIIIGVICRTRGQGAPVGVGSGYKW